jgi:hypothetical protein
MFDAFFKGEILGRNPKLAAAARVAQEKGTLWFRQGPSTGGKIRALDAQ